MSLIPQQSPYTRQDLQRRVIELDLQVQDCVKRGDIATSNRIAEVASRLSHALVCSWSDKYTDESNGRVYSLVSARLLGGSGETLEDAERFDSAGNALKSQGKLTEALEQYQRSLAIRERLDPGSLSVAMSYYNIGKVYQHQGKLPERFEEYQKGVVIRESLFPGSMGEAECNARIGEIKKIQYKLSEALVLFQRILAIREPFASESRESHSFRKSVSDEVGEITKIQGKLPEALELYQKILQIRERLSSGSLSEAQSYHSIGKKYYSEGKFLEALELYQRSIAIKERLVPGSLDLAAAHDDIGNVCQALRREESKNLKNSMKQYQKNLAIREEALEQYQKSLVIKERLTPDSLDVAESYDHIGKIYTDQSKDEEALALFQRSLEIRDRCAPGSLDVAKSYHSIGNLYFSQGKGEEALEQYQKCLEIRERLAPGSVDLAASHEDIGEVFGLIQNKLPEALNQYRRGLEIRERLNPDSLDVAEAYYRIGSYYEYQCGECQEALEQYQKGLAISERLVPGSMGVAKFYDSIGELHAFSLLNKLEGLAMFQRSLAIKERLVPGSLDVAEVHSYIGLVYKYQDKLPEAMEQYQRCLAIMERFDDENSEVFTRRDTLGDLYLALGKLPEALEQYQRCLTHWSSEHQVFLVWSSIDCEDFLKPPDYLDHIANSCDKIGKVFLKLEDYPAAITYATKGIQNNPDCKYAHDTLGLAFHKLGNLQEALAAFDQALRCDPGYADATIHRLAVITEIANKTENFERVAEEFAKAKRLEKTDYDQEKKAEFEQFAKASKQEMTVTPPKQEFEAGTKNYLEQLAKLGDGDCNPQLKAIIAHLFVRVQTLEERVDLLDGQVLEMSDSLGMIQTATEKLDEKMRTMSASDPLLEQLRFEKGKLVERETHIKAFNRNADLRHYFYALLSELEASYIAAQAMQSGKLTVEKTGTCGKAAGYAEKLIDLIPLIGKTISTIVTVAADLADLYTNSTPPEVSP